MKTFQVLCLVACLSTVYEGVSAAKGPERRLKAGTDDSNRRRLKKGKKPKNKKPPTAKPTPKPTQPKPVTATTTTSQALSKGTKPKFVEKANQKATIAILELDEELKTIVANVVDVDVDVDEIDATRRRRQLKTTDTFESGTKLTTTVKKAKGDECSLTKAELKAVGKKTKCVLVIQEITTLAGEKTDATQLVSKLEGSFLDGSYTEALAGEGIEDPLIDSIATAAPSKKATTPPSSVDITTTPPTKSPTVSPSSTPTSAPSSTPTSAPSSTPTSAPSSTPTVEVTESTSTASSGSTSSASSGSASSGSSGSSTS